MLKDNRNEDENHYYIKLKEISDELLSVKQANDRNRDLVEFVIKDVMYLYDTFEGSANTLLYIERLLELAENI